MERARSSASHSLSLSHLSKGTMPLTIGHALQDRYRIDELLGRPHGKGPRVTDDQLPQASSLEGATMPDGTEYTAEAKPEPPPEEPEADDTEKPTPKMGLRAARERAGPTQKALAEKLGVSEGPVGAERHDSQLRRCAGEGQGRAGDGAVARVRLGEEEATKEFTDAQALTVGQYLRCAICGQGVGPSDLHRAHLGDADLHRADPGGADLGRAHLEGADLRAARQRPPNAGTVAQQVEPSQRTSTPHRTRPPCARPTVLP
jgi:hypothetical protein